MKKNPVIPYAIIAVVGLGLMLVLSFVGLNQMDEVQQAHDGGEKQEQKQDDNQELAGPEDIYKNNCAMCHGADLSGSVGPSLQQVGSTLDAAKIQDIILNGTDSGGMAGQPVSNEQASVLAEWLAEKK